MEPLQITSVGDLSGATQRAQEKLHNIDNWWRGEPQIYDTPLLPKLYRGNLAEHEISMNSRFMVRAPTRHAKCPNAPEGWLYLMQHYGLPTRLLDWTESLLIATFSACKNHLEETGVVWGLNPFKLNLREINREQIVGPGDPTARTIIRRAFNKRGPQLDGEKVVALLCEEIDIRMMIQQSGFTIHSTKIPLDPLNDWKEFLVRFEIPAKAKVPLQRELELFGLTNSYLFPDLKHLAEKITSDFST